MGDFSVEQKLQLIRQVRSQHDRDRLDLMNRERILFGKTGEYGDIHTNKELVSTHENTEMLSNTQAGSLKSTLFKIRLLSAIVLAVFLILLDQKNGLFFGIDTSQVFSILASDYYQQMEEYLSRLQ